MESLSQYCRRRDLPKGTVHRHLTSLGFDLSGGLSAAAVVAIEERWPVVEALVEVEAPSALATVDPFSGAGAGNWNPAGALSVVSRRAAADHLANDAHTLIAAAALANNQTITAAAGAADQLGDQLGSLLAQRTIAAAESRRQTILGDYLASQGVAVGESIAPQSQGRAA